MIKHFMRPDSNTPPAYTYVEGEDTDSLWDPNTCIEVPKQPSMNHVYNMTTEEWELLEEYYMTDLRAKRDALLIESDKYMLSDYPISAEDKVLIETYRQTLRDAPDHPLLKDRVLPKFPL